MTKYEREKLSLILQNRYSFAINVQCLTYANIAAPVVLNIAPIYICLYVHKYIHLKNEPNRYQYLRVKGSPRSSDYAAPHKTRNSTFYFIQTKSEVFLLILFNFNEIHHRLSEFFHIITKNSAKLYKIAKFPFGHHGGHQKLEKKSNKLAHQQIYSPYFNYFLLQIITKTLEICLGIVF